ncbi:ABC transporter permease [Nocardia puris]|uniref:Putative ABC transport system permease protein n=1 Tax=Nocardia puris TaxID=208602 RepID=A0A366E4L7_9NOCA|nr:ABC transporter permease [Nocardia puris]MBF6216090.1 ABC transporter permease [Nocardia puris]MBF6462474.1 ABC transporter permease [Nocardia puris]RBO97055.1 putative ABC transport system permease protein [Nocardia puris]
MRGRIGAALRVFGRLHLAAVLRDWRRNVFTVVGVAVGVTLVVAVVQLNQVLLRPFDAFGPALAEGAGSEVLQVIPLVEGRLPAGAVAEVAAVPGVDAVVPVTAGMTQIDLGGGAEGFFVLGATCAVERLLGPFDCAGLASATRLTPGPGLPLGMSEDAARDLGLTPGAPIPLPGRAADAAHLGWTFPARAPLDGMNAGRVLLATSPTDAGRVLGASDHLTSLFVLPHAGADLSGALAAATDGIASVGPPRPQIPAIYASSKQTLDLTAIAGLLIGVLIAVNTVLFGFERRRRVMGTIGVLGATPRRILAGFLGEGALLGAVGGLLAVPTGYLLGAWLVDRFGRSVLSGSGAELALAWDRSIIALGVGAGAVCGLLAMAVPAWQLVREGPLASVAGFGGVQAPRRVSWYPMLAGVALIVLAIVVLRRFNKGEVSLTVGNAGIFLGLAGFTAAMISLTPRLVRVLVTPVAARLPAIGRLAHGDIRRYALMFASTAAIAALGATLAIGAQTMQALLTADVSGHKTAGLPTSLVIEPKSMLDQRPASIDDATYARIEEAARGNPVDDQWTAVIPSPTEPRLIVGVTPGSRQATALATPLGDADRLWNGLRAGEIGLSVVAAGRLGAAAGDTVTLPTPTGYADFRVAGVFDPAMLSDSPIGDVVLVSGTQAAQRWAAARTRVAVHFPSAPEAAAQVDTFAALGEGLSVYDNDRWRAAAATVVPRFFEPFTVTGYVIMGIAGVSVLNIFLLGLVQRRRERAVVRALGATPGVEQAVIVVQAALLAAACVAAGLAGGSGLVYLQALTSPVNYGVQVDWGAVGRPLVVVPLCLVAMAAAAALYPVLHARRLETAAELRSN